MSQINQKQENSLGEILWDNNVENQGWNENSELMIIKEFLTENNLWKKLAEFSEDRLL